MLVNQHESLDQNKNRHIYIDAVPSDLHNLGFGERYALTKQRNGCFQRIIGKDEIKSVIYNGDMPNFVDDFFLSKDLEVIFVTTTFGGFGSAVVYEVSDYYCSKIKNFRSVNNVHPSFKCKIIAFPLANFNYLMTSQDYLITRYSTNEIEFINEFRKNELRNNVWYQRQSNCIPFVNLFVPLLSPADNLYEVLDFSDDKLTKLDCKKRYYLSSVPEKRKPEVFISYSSKNQAVADMLVNIAEENGISCWIASSSIEAGSYAKQIVQGIKAAHIFVVIVSNDSMESPHVKNELDIATGRISEGLIIMPFQIDNTELDDECKYYLCRQEFFMGKTPPIEERIKQFVLLIKKALNI